MTDLIKVISLNVLMALLLWHWKAHGAEGAGNMFLAVLWFYIVVGIAFGLLGDKSMATKPGKVIRALMWPKSFAWFLALAYFGHFVIAGFYLFSCFMYVIALERDPKPKAAEQ